MEEEKKKQKQRHFVLIHGGCHGAWSWYKVASLLKSYGHKVTALDMVACGIHPKQVNEIQSISDYFQPLIEFMMSLPQEERVILVGHSHGGLGASIAMEMFPEKISASVFASAMMPGPDLTYTTIQERYMERLELKDSQYMFDNGPNNPPTSILLGPNIIKVSMYQQSPPEDIMLARMLLRPHPVDNVDDAKKLVFTKEKYESVSRIFIICGEDKILDKEYVQKWMVDENPPDEVMVISDADHMPMFSNPWKFASCLEQIAKKYF